MPSEFMPSLTAEDFYDPRYEQVGEQWGSLVGNFIGMGLASVFPPAALTAPLISAVGKAVGSEIYRKRGMEQAGRKLKRWRGYKESAERYVNALMKRRYVPELKYGDFLPMERRRAILGYGIGILPSFNPEYEVENDPWLTPPPSMPWGGFGNYEGFPTLMPILTPGIPATTLGVEVLPKTYNELFRSYG
ncbi:MAG: hypothetical protein RMM53_13970 [Bacteroidia bacterium]|nr:hypothetical protein [Bacteroidia bacterium]